MNNITTVNLGGYPFTIDENAHKALDLYLETIEAHFSDSEGCDEILDDIEARIAELFTDFLQGKSIVTLKEYDAMVKVMGRPEDFGAKSIDEDDMESSNTSKTKKRKGKYSHIKTGKRLFRDPDEKVIGGVCSGIAAYFGVADPLWIRLGFIALVFIGGLSVLLYPILWAIVPPAKTAGDKLKMKGEPATVSNIAKTVEEELTELSNKITEISKDLGSKKKVKAASFLSPKRAVSGIISGLGSMVLGVIKLLKMIFKPIFSLTLGVLLLVLGVVWAAWIISYLSSFSFINSIGPSPWILSSIGGFAAFLTIGIPIIGLMLFITRWFSSYRIPSKWRSGLRLGWVTSFVIASGIAIMTSMSFNHDTEISERASYSIDEDVITINRLETPENKTVGIINFGGLKYAKGGLINDEVGLEVVLGNEDEVVITTNVFSKGGSYNEAQKLANNVDAHHKVEDNNIYIPKEFKIKKGDKYRDQSILYTVNIPVGKSIKFDESLAHWIWRSTKFKVGGTPQNFEDYTWTMTDEGLVSNGWLQQFHAKRVIDVKNLANLNLDGRMRTSIKYGPKAEIKLLGIKSDLEKVEEIVTEDATKIILDNWTEGGVALEIITPNLEILSAKNLSSLSLEGFNQEKMEVNYSGRLHSNRTITAYMDVKDLTLNIGGSNDIDLTGSGENLNVNILDGSRVTADQYKAATVKVSGNIYSRSTFYASESFDCPKYKTDHIKLFGNPELLALNMQKTD